MVYLPHRLQNTIQIPVWFFILTERPGLEGTSRILKLQCHSHRQGRQPPYLMLDQAAQGPIQPALEYLQGWTGHPQPLWAAVPALHHSQSKELPSDIQPKSSLLPLTTISPCPAVISPFKELTPLLFVGSPLDTERLQWCHPTAFSSPGWTSPAPWTRQLYNTARTSSSNVMRHLSICSLTSQQIHNLPTETKSHFKWIIGSDNITWNRCVWASAVPSKFIASQSWQEFSLVVTTDANLNSH